MKRCLLMLTLMLLMASCDQVIFPGPQPSKVKHLTEIPGELQGTFLDQDGDSLFVGKTFFAYHDNELSSMRHVSLSDSAVLKAYREHYYFSMPVDLEAGRFWLTYIIYPGGNTTGFDVYNMDPGDIVKLAKLQEISSKIRDIEEGEQKFYLFDPGKRDYKKIISDTIFSRMISFTRIEK